MRADHPAPSLTIDVAFIGSPSTQVSNAPAGTSGPSRPRRGYDVVKRLMDLALGGTALVLLAPVIAAAAILVKVTSPGPTMYRAQRVGRHGRPFEMLKLRTMYVDADHSAQQEFNRRELCGELEGVEDYTIVDDPRVTPVGRVLRRASIDELPQLVNVLKGDMSLVGPRPSSGWEVELFDEHHRRREDVLPGMTGLWQVSGRRTIDMPGMLELDVTYVDSRSIGGDVGILLRTVPAVISQRGAS